MKHAVLFSLLLASSVASADYIRVVPGVRVTVAPPALKVEVPPPAPSRHSTWIQGYWRWQGGKHMWIGGHWANPPHTGYVWEPARWSQESGAWMFYDGHWRAGEEPTAGAVYVPPPPPAVEVVAESAPPAEIVEARGNPPFAGATWVPGYWHWHGKHHTWVAGRWSAPPPGHHFVGHNWEKRGDGKYVERPGYWERDKH